MITSRLLLGALVLTLGLLTACDGQNKSAPAPAEEAKEASEATPESGPQSSETAKPSLEERSTERTMSARSDQEKTLWVMQSQGRRQCEGGGISLEQSRATLQQNGINVAESRCAVRTDLMFPQVCGGATGDILVHRIPASMLDTALALGFDPAAQVKYRFSECPPDTGPARNPAH